MNWWERLRRKLNATADMREGAAGWSAMTGYMTTERPEAARQAQARDALEAWRSDRFAGRRST